MLILLIEDDPQTADFVVSGLEARGHEVEVSRNGRAGMIKAAESRFDVAIVDRMLPEIDGLSLLRALRASAVSTPAIFLTALGGVSDRVEGLRAGADDYLVKPFDIDELDARVQALGRRPPFPEAMLLQQGPFVLDRLKRRATAAGRELSLTASEFAMLDMLMLNAGRRSPRRCCWSTSSTSTATLPASLWSRTSAGCARRSPTPDCRIPSAPCASAATASMRIRRLARAASFRQAAVQTAAFLVTFVLAGLVALFVIRGIETRAARAEIAQLEDDMTDLYRARGATALIARLDAPKRDPSRVFRLEDAHGARLAGGLPPLPTPQGAPSRRWLEAVLGSWPASHHILAYTRDEPGGLRLTVGEDLSVDDRKDDAVLGVIVGLALGVAGLGLLLGALNGRRVVARVDAMARVMEAYAAGDREARNPPSERSPDELDELASALNRLMVRENGLVEGLRQVSSSLAHDLRRPLARHNQAIAEVLAEGAGEAELREALMAASDRVGEVLQTFQALLHIAELEAGAPGLAAAPVDLAALARTIVEAYGPLAEKGGRILKLESPDAAVPVTGEARVLGRMIANLVENGLAHTPPGTTVSVRVEADGRRLIVSDDGPGVPEAARTRIVERFYRLDASRSTPGSGLGLALAAATCRAFGGELSVHANNPGLRVVADFERGERRPSSETEVRSRRGRSASDLIAAG